MGDARRRRKMLEKKRQELRELETRSVKLRESADGLCAQLDEITKDEEARLEFNDLCNRIGPKLFAKDCAYVARFMLDSKMADMKNSGKRTEEEVTELTPRLSRILSNNINIPQNKKHLEEAADMFDALSEASGGKIDPNEKNRGRLVGEILSVLFARRMLTEKGEKEEDYDPNLYIPFREIDWAKHMQPDEMATAAKSAITMFLKDHERGLTGRALRAKQTLDALPAQGKIDIRQSLIDDAEGDFASIEAQVVPKFFAMYPKVDPNERSKAFMDLFAMVREAMEHPNRPGDVVDVDAVAYLVAERIFLKGAVAGAESLDRRDAFEKTLASMTRNLTGAMALGRDTFKSLSTAESTACLRFVETMPRSIYDGTQKAIGEYLESRSEDARKKSFVNLQLLGDGLLPTVSELMKEHRTLPVIPNQNEVLAYLVAQRVLFMGFEESVRTREKPLGEWNDLWTDSDLTKAGVMLWERTYHRGASDAEVVKEANASAHRWGEDSEEKGIPVNNHRRGVYSVIMAWTAKWAVHAFQRITTTHTYAAALMCSDADRTVLEDIEMQWHGFMVIVPNGLLKYRDEERGIDSEYNRILVASYDESATLVLLNQEGKTSGYRIVTQVSSNMADLLEVRDTTMNMVHTIEDMEAAKGTKESIGRIVTLAKRLVAGLLLTLQNQNNFKSKTYPARDGKKHREVGSEPEHRVVFVGAPLKIDCRASVADYIRNGSPKRKGAPPQVQTLVRGHHKRQVVGVGRLGRKVIWVSPFWRGPEDAPILTRPKRVG